MISQFPTLGRSLTFCPIYCCSLCESPGAAQLTIAVPSGFGIELPYTIALKRFPAIDARIPWRQDIGQLSGALRKRQTLDTLPKLTRQFGRYSGVMYGNRTGS